MFTNLQLSPLGKGRVLIFLTSLSTLPKFKKKVFKWRSISGEKYEIWKIYDKITNKGGQWTNFDQKSTLELRLRLAEQNIAAQT